MSYLAGIQYFETVNGEGVGHSIYLSGCTFKCVGCFNKKAWDFKYGEPLTSEVLQKFLQRCIQDAKAGYITRCVVLGGEPFHPNNVDTLDYILWYIKTFTNVGTHVYTGYLYEELLDNNDSIYRSALENTDVLVDGRFVQELAEVNLAFRGSSNQRIIQIKNNKTEEE